MREGDLNQPGHLEALSTLSEEGALKVSLGSTKAESS